MIFDLDVGDVKEGDHIIFTKEVQSIECDWVGRRRTIIFTDGTALRDIKEDKTLDASTHKINPMNWPL